MLFGYETALILLVYCILLAAGYGYNRLVAWLEREGYDEGYTAFLVVGGVGFTLLGVAIVDWQAALLAFGAFAASGLFMFLGSWQRHAIKRRHEQLLHRQQVEHREQ